MLHRARLIVVFVLVGAVVNVLVAWGCALWSPVGFEKPRYRLSAPRLHRLGLAHGQPARVQQSITLDVGPEPYHFHARGLGVRREGGLISLDLFHQVVLSGFPFLALEAVHTTGSADRGNTDTASEWLWALRPPEMLRPVKGPLEPFFFATQDRPLPLRLVMPGFALNTAIYAVAAAGLYVLPVGARRALRRRRGLCIHCGYDARSLAVCPECGRMQPAQKGVEV